MTLLFYILLYVYGIAMGGSSIVSFIPIWLICFNCFGALILFLSPFSIVFFYLGLIILTLVAIINGFVLNGFPNWKHLVVRITFSLFLIFLYHYKNK